MKMQAVVLKSFGGPEVLTFESVEVPDPGPGEVRLKVTAIGINRAEIMLRKGAYPMTGELPIRMGFEAAGYIDAAGPGITTWKSGDRAGVVPGTFNAAQAGAYAEYMVVPETALAPVPVRSGQVESAAIWMGYFTAWGSLIHTAQPRKNATVFINAAASSVGIPALQICRKEHFTAIAATRSQEKISVLADQGAKYVIDTRRESVADRIAEYTKAKGVDAALDPVTGSGFEAIVSAIGKNGRIVVYSSLDPEPVKFPARTLMSKNASLHGFLIFNAVKDPEILTTGKHYVMEGFETGAFRPVIAKTFKFPDIAGAHAFMESNKQIGKIVVTL